MYCFEVNVLLDRRERGARWRGGGGRGGREYRRGGGG